jgi:hypothetical protein
MAQPPSPQPPGQPGELDAYLSQVAAGAVVYKEGEASGHVYFVQRGRVELSIEGPPASVLGVAGIGDFFGEAALLDDDPRTHTAKALSATTLLKVDRATMHQLIAQHPEIATRMLYAVVGRERERPAPEPISVEGITAPPPAPKAPPAPEVTAKAPTAVSPPAPAAAPVAPEPPAPAAPATPPRLEKASLLHASKARFEVSAAVAATVGRPDRASGKAPEIDLSALDTGQTLSRQHAVITWRDGVFYVKEVKATRNGTFVNGQRVAVGTDIPLAPGDRLRFGLVELVFQAS